MVQGDLAVVVHRLAYGANEMAGLLPHDVGVGSHDSITSYHYVGESLVSPSSSICSGTSSLRAE